jgi:hypothetical protein
VLLLTIRPQIDQRGKAIRLDAAEVDDIRLTRDSKRAGDGGEFHGERLSAFIIHYRIMYNNDDGKGCPIRLEFSYALHVRFARVFPQRIARSSGVRQ